MLQTEASAALRDRLAAELEGIRSADEAARWAHRVLGAKSTLTAADAKRIEDEFQNTNLRCSQPLRIGGGAKRLVRPGLRASTRAN